MNLQSSTRNGLADWLLQRLSALVILAFILCVVGFCLAKPGFDFEEWHNYFSSYTMRIFTFVTLLAVLGHVWIGIWTVLTDYVTNRSLRLVCQAGLLLFVLVVLAGVSLVIINL